MPAAAATPLDALQSRLNYVFRNPTLLRDALTHPTYLQDHPEAGAANQRLEFLGDAVLQLVLTEKLFQLYPAEREGVLSKRRSALTKGAFLTALALEIGLDRCLRMGASEESTGGRHKAGALEDVFEALVAALYLDSDLATVARVLLGLYGELPARLGPVESEENPKGRLQEWVQPTHGNDALRYDVVAVAGADHARDYEVAVYLQDRPIGQGRGPSKKLAEEAAARSAWDALGHLPCPPPPPAQG
jgi:ribonuclease-3